VAISNNNGVLLALFEIVPAFLTLLAVVAGGAGLSWLASTLP
jgi:hypothetical protein